MALHLISKYLQSSNSRFQNCLPKTNFKPLSSSIWRRKRQPSIEIWQPCYQDATVEAKSIGMTLKERPYYLSPAPQTIHPPRNFQLDQDGIWKEIKLFTAAWELTNFLVFMVERSIFLSQVEDTV